VKGDSSSNVMKEVVIEGGTKVKVPLFVNEGDGIRIDTRDGSYIDRI
jgi:elongation factor P